MPEHSNTGAHVNIQVHVNIGAHINIEVHVFLPGHDAAARHDSAVMGLRSLPNCITIVQNGFQVGLRVYFR